MDDNFAEYWPWALWPLSSPDCNPLDYAVWGLLETKVGATPHPNIVALKATITKEWRKMSAAFVVTSCKRFRSRIEAVVRANGDHIEKKCCLNMYLVILYTRNEFVIDFI